MPRRGAVRLKCAGLQNPDECGVSDRQLTPFGQGGGTVLLEDIAAVEVLILVEVVVYRGVDRSEFLKCGRTSEFRHRTLSSPERLVGIFGPVVEPTAALLRCGIADYLHRRSVRTKPVGYN